MSIGKTDLCMLWDMLEVNLPMVELADSQDIQQIVCWNLFTNHFQTTYQFPIIIQINFRDIHTDSTSHARRIYLICGVELSFPFKLPYINFTIQKAHIHVYEGNLIQISNNEWVSQSNILYSSFRDNSCR